MNKIKITKGRLRKIIAEEVARHSATKLNENNALMRNINRWSEEGKDIPPERTAAKMADADIEDWEAHFNAIQDRRFADTSPEASPTGDARTRMSVSAAEDEWHSDEYETLADRKYADSLREQVKETLEEMLSDEPLEERYQGAKSKPTKQAWGKPTPSEKKVEKEKDRKAGKKQAQEVDEGLEDRLAKFNKGPSTEERREKLKKITAANKAKKEKDKK